MLGTQLSTNEWLSFPLQVRLRIHDEFSLTRSSFTEVVGGIVTCDGHTYEDLSELTADRIEEYLGITPGELGFYILVQKLVAKIQNEIDLEYAEEMRKKQASLFDTLQPGQVLTPGVKEPEAPIAPIINANDESNEQTETKEDNKIERTSSTRTTTKRSSKKKA